MPKQLLASENLVLPPLHRHWIVLVRGAAPVVLGAALILGLLNLAAHGLVAADVRLLLAVATGAFVGLRLLVVGLRWEGDTLTVTDQRVVLEQGVSQRSSRVIPLYRVQDVSTAQTLLGRLLDYGTIDIDVAGAGGVERFTYVSRPERVRDHVFVEAGRFSRAS